ncbi:MAG TPA: PAS domain S-box protein, partial [Methanomicrobiales archaeon]|nr:PAS domain S-box protein [Methanomicrobiales archaeon]
PEGTLMIASRPLLTSSGDGPVRGTLLMGRYLNSEVIEHIGTLTSLSLEVIPPEDPEVPPEVASAFNEPGKENVAFIQPFSEDTLAVFSVIRDVSDHPSLVLRVEVPRDIYLQGQASTMNFILLILSVCLLFGVVTLFALENLALLPLATLNAKVGMLGERADPDARLEVKGDDELSHLGRTINRMLESLSLTQRALAEDEKRYRAVVEDQTEFICRYLPDGTHIFVNEAYCRYFGKDRSEVLGHVFKPPIPEEDRERMRQHFASLSADKPVATIEHRIVMPDGSVRWQQWTDRLILDADGKIVEYQSVGRDITDRKKVEEALFLANEKLNLLGSVTRHDLLNQLTAVQGYVQLAEEFGTDPEIRKYLSTANEVAGKMRDLIQFSRDYQNLGVHAPQWRIVQETILSAAVTLSLGRVHLQVELDGL